MILESSASQLFVENYNAWIPNVILVLILNIVLLALYYMASKILGSRTNEAKVKEEFYQVIFTIGLIVVIGMIITSGDVLINNLTLDQFLGENLMQQVKGQEGQSINIFDVNYIYLNYVIKQLKGKMDSYVAYTRLYDWMFSLYPSMSFKNGVVSLPNPVREVLYTTGLFEKVTRKYYMAEQYAWLSILAYLFRHIFIWIENTMLQVYLPLALIMRMFPPTRAGGATLISLVISLYIIFPYSLALLYLTGPVDLTENSGNGNLIEGNFCPMDYENLDILMQNPSIIVNQPDLDGTDARGFNKIRLYGFYYPLLALITAFLFSRYMAQILGGDLGNLGMSIARVV